MITVFGAGGYVGRNLVEKLLETNIDFIATNKVPNPYKNRVRYEQIDITKNSDVDKAIKESDIIVHLATSTLLQSLKDPRKNEQINIDGTLNILDSCRKYDVEKIIFSSASSVIGKAQYNPVDEKHPCMPTNPYAVSKLAIEHYLRVYKEMYGLNHLIFRFFGVYGPYGKNGLIPAIYNAISKKEDFFIHGDGSQMRDYIYVGDIIDYIIKACQQPTVKNTIINLGTGIGTRIMGILKLTSEILNIDIDMKFSKKRIGERDDYYADITKLKQIFGEPKIKLRKGLEKTIKWYETNKESL